MTALAPGFRVGCALVWLMLLACSDSHRNVDAAAPDDPPDAAVAKRVNVRTVSIELFKTGERLLESAADGSFQYGALTDIGGVKVCVAQRRAAFASFEPFEPLEKPICATSVERQTVVLNDLPINSDLVITVAKDGYETNTLTFRTDEQDVGAPPVGASLELVPKGGFDPWLELKPQAAAGDGAVAIVATAFWTGAESGPGYVQAEGVSVAITRADGSPVVDPLTTLRERPLKVSLPAGLYRFSFSHPRMKMRPAFASGQYLIAGLPTDAQDTVEVPVLAGDVALAMIFADCGGPVWGPQFQDLATCTLAPLDAGTP